MAEPDKRPVTMEELLVSSLAQIHALAKLSIETGLITREVFLETVMSVDERKIKTLSAGTFLFAGLFLTEGIGLLLQKKWGAYLTIIATASFVPLEVFELAKKFSVAKVVVIGINVLVVCYLIA